MNDGRFRGVYAFNATPTVDDGAAVDIDGVRRIAEFVVECGVHGVVVFGSTGANGSFTSAERLDAAKAAVDSVAGRIPVLAGIGSMTTAETVDLARAMAAEAGVDGLLVVPISYWRLTGDEVYAHFERIASAVDLPLVVYNNPWTTRVDIEPPLVAQLAGLDTVRYVKESSGDPARIGAIRRLAGDGVAVFAGWDTLVLDALAAGAAGWFTGMTNFAPRECVALYDLAVGTSDEAAARDLFERLRPLCDFVDDRSQVRCAHAALEILGLPAGAPRRPLRPLADADKATLRRLMRECGVLDGHDRAAE